jgi:MFS family permease
LEASTKIKKLTGKYRGSLAAASATGAIVAGILGSWLTGHWLWGLSCVLLALIVFVASAEALKARNEDGRSNALAVNSPALGGPYISLNDAGPSYRFEKTLETLPWGAAP